MISAISSAIRLKLSIVRNSDDKNSASNVNKAEHTWDADSLLAGVGSWTGIHLEKHECLLFDTKNNNMINFLTMVKLLTLEHLLGWPAIQKRK